MRRSLPGFTLAEVLIVLGVVVAIAWWMSSGTIYCDARRMKVSRARSDIRSLATAIESYNVDLGEFPPPLRLAAQHSVDLLARPISRRSTRVA